MTQIKKIKHVDFCILRTWAYFEGLKYNKFTPKWSALHRMNRKKRKCYCSKGSQSHLKLKTTTIELDWSVAITRELHLIKLD